VWRSVPVEFGVEGFYGRCGHHYVYWRDLRRSDRHRDHSARTCTRSATFAMMWHRDRISCLEQMLATWPCLRTLRNSSFGTRNGPDCRSLTCRIGA
jgi:hypothetical protein